MHKYSFNADLHHVYARLAGQFRAPLVESVQHDTRNVEAPVQFGDGAPQDSESPEQRRIAM